MRINCFVSEFTTDRLTLIAQIATAYISDYGCTGVRCTLYGTDSASEDESPIVVHVGLAIVSARNCIKTVECSSFMSLRG